MAGGEESMMCGPRPSIAFEWPSIFDVPAPGLPPEVAVVRERWEEIREEAKAFKGACQDCEFYSYQRCEHPALAVPSGIDPISGDIVLRRDYCLNLREEGGGCGPEDRLFSRKPKPSWWSAWGSVVVWILSPPIGVALIAALFKLFAHG